MKLTALVLGLALPGMSGSDAVALRPRAAASERGTVSLPGVVRPVLARVDVSAEPAAGELRSRGEAALTAEERARRDAAIEALVAAEAGATESPETAEGPLQDALAAFAEVAPLVSDDARAQEARAYAMLALARTRLVLARPGDAEAALDEAIATVRDRPLPIEQFGPAMMELFAQRTAARAAMPLASLAVRCAVPCRVLVDEQPFSDSLAAGDHRVWIEALAPGQPVLRRELRLAPGESVELTYQIRAPEPEPEPPVATPPAPPRRILPRWASVLGLAAGTGAVAAGGALVGVDHRCPDLSDPRQVPCLRILNTDAGGFALLGVGGAVAITAAVILAIDEARARRARKRQ